MKESMYRFVKPLWVIVMQANRLSVNSFILQTQQIFLEGTLFQPLFTRKKDTWCDMTHSVVNDQACVRWLLCNDIIPKAIHQREGDWTKGKSGTTQQHQHTD